MRVGAILSVCCVLAVLPLHVRVEAASGKLTLAQVQRLIRDKGATAIADATLQSKWDQLLRAVATGNGAWLDVAAEFLHHSDGEDSESLNASVGEALAHSPRAVLRKLDGVYLRAENVCGNTFGGSGLLGAPERAAATSLAAQERAVAAVPDGELASRRDTCLDLIR